MGGRPDQADIAVLDVRQEGILLRAAEAVDLIHEKNGFAPADPAAGHRPGDRLAHVCHARSDSRKPDELRIAETGHDFGKAGLAGSGRAGEDDRAEPVRIDRAPEQLPLAEQMGLADVFGELARAKTRRERHIRARGRSRLRGGRRLFRLIQIEQILFHPAIPVSMTISSENRKTHSARSDNHEKNTVPSLPPEFRRICPAHISHTVRHSSGKRESAYVKADQRPAATLSSCSDRGDRDLTPVNFFPARPRQSGAAIIKAHFQHC